jgi:hypothetical protein
MVFRDIAPSISVIADRSKGEPALKLLQASGPSETHNIAKHPLSEAGGGSNSTKFS